MAACCETLEGVHIAERDHNGDVMLAWSYPGSDAALDAHVLRRCAPELERDASGLAAALKHEGVGAVGSLFWTRFQAHWVYVLPFAVGGQNPALPQVAAFAVVLQSKQFDPEKHAAICGEMAKAYASAGTPLKVLEGYLSIMTLSSFGGFSEDRFAAEDAKRGAAPIGWLIELFGVEVVLLWTALLLKKRVLVYSNKLPELQRCLRVLPALVWHRDNWNILRPYVCASHEEDLDELQGVFCAGVTEPLDSRQDLWDLYVDLPALTITVADGARKDFTMTSVHKDVAGALISTYADGDGSNAAIIDMLAGKTRDVIAKLEMLAEAEEDGLLTGAALHGQLSNPVLAHYIYACMYTYMHTYILTTAHTHTHTHTHKPAQALANFLFSAALAERLATDAVGRDADEEPEQADVGEDETEKSEDGVPNAGTGPGQGGGGGDGEGDDEVQTE